MLFTQNIYGKNVVVKLDDVLIEHKDNLYVCRWDNNPLRLKCGKCNKGNLSFTTKEGRILILESCKICKSKTKIIT